eukprot:Rmarinus@m.2549
MVTWHSSSKKFYEGGDTPWNQDLLWKLYVQCENKIYFAHKEDQLVREAEAGNFDERFGMTGTQLAMQQASGQRRGACPHCLRSHGSSPHHHHHHCSRHHSQRHGSDSPHFSKVSSTEGGHDFSRPLTGGHGSPHRMSPALRLAHHNSTHADRYRGVGVGFPRSPATRDGSLRGSRGRQSVHSQNQLGAFEGDNGLSVSSPLPPAAVSRPMTSQAAMTTDIRDVLALQSRVSSLETELDQERKARVETSQQLQSLMNKLDHRASSSPGKSRLPTLVRDGGTRSPGSGPPARVRGTSGKDDLREGVAGHSLARNVKGRLQDSPVRSPVGRGPLPHAGTRGPPSPSPSPSPSRRHGDGQRLHQPHRSPLRAHRSPGKLGPRGFGGAGKQFNYYAQGKLDQVTQAPRSPGVARK